MIVYNELSSAQILKPGTRFVTEEGVVYRTSDWVNVPPARSLNGITEIGTMEVYMKADQYDEAGKIIGIR